MLVCVPCFLSIAQSPSFKNNVEPLSRAFARVAIWITLFSPEQGLSSLTNTVEIARRRSIQGGDLEISHVDGVIRHNNSRVGRRTRKASGVASVARTLI